jgi:Ca2+-binding EF-hand superfamily protein
VLSDFGYVTSVEAVYECLDKLDEVEEEDSLTIEELALFLREYRKVEGFTHAEIAEFEAAFQSTVNSAGRDAGKDQAKGLDTLAVGRVLRWFGISTNLQQVHQLLEELDFDNSGLIEFTEFIKMMRRLYQDHANQVRFLFNKLDRQKMGFIPVSELTTAVHIFEGALGDPVMVAKARAQAKLPEFGSVDRPGFEEFFRQWRKVAIDQVRSRAGYSTLEVSRLREAFKTFDKDNSGTIEKEEFQDLIRTYFPDALKSRTEQQDVVRLIKDVDSDGNDSIDFNEFLHLLRKCDDMRDSADIKLEKEVVKECGFSQEEADGFRQVFTEHISWTGLQTRANLYFSSMPGTPALKN